MSGWTPREIADLSGRVAVVTGANGGLGRHVALELARHRATVVLACRGEEKAEEVRRWISDQVPEATLEPLLLDLGSLRSVEAAAAALHSRHAGLDILVNNAGVMGIARETTDDGFERQFGVNHLGHFALTGRLLDLLLARPGPRVVTVSSGVARNAHIDFDDLQGTRRYRRWAAYGQAKLANLLFALELARRAEIARTPLVSVAAHPGYADTNLQERAGRSQGGDLGARLARLGNRILAQPAAAGAWPLLWAATSSEVENGEYVGPGGPLEMRGAPRKVAPPAQALDRATARRLWEVSEELTGVRYEVLDAALRAA